MNARRSSIGQETTGQQADANHAQGDTGMPTASTTTSTMTDNADSAAHQLAGLLRAALLSLILALGLIGAHAALADPQPGAAQADGRQHDSAADKQAGKDNKGQDAGKDKGNKQDEHAPTLTLTAPAPGSATLYPAAITVIASIVGSVALTFSWVFSILYVVNYFKNTLPIVSVI